PLVSQTGDGPIAAAAADLDGDGNLDLAVLNDGSADVSIFLGDGHGGFTPKQATDEKGNPVLLLAGRQPAGLAVADVTQDGNPALLIGNQEGDLLVLQGNGHGTFRPYAPPEQRADQSVSLTVTDLDGNHRDDFVLGKKHLDQVAVRAAGASADLQQLTK